MKHHCEGFGASFWFSGEGCPQPVVNLRPGEFFTDPQAELIGQIILVGIAVGLFLFLIIATRSITD